MDWLVRREVVLQECFLCLERTEHRVADGG